eukprot:CAMPEP_0204620928 /NCGR_PEP_ID=MMETSP0717-20131115/6811_1 /ASSEMBLY_ACC=CAM_ASM_000666 /TAXON_ID=230516 /ORGANISM="Chaetoceros curvisetus" /LENGTH=285 /DNA_ID=CAMNT_0051635231 /DNA_START=192 /DNA_END=1049 /DNA_ORIENTATION=-
MSITKYDFDVPSEFAGPLEAYPNPLGITPSMRQVFHPVVKMFNPQIIDLTQTTGTSQLILPQDQDDFERKHGKRSISRKRTLFGFSLSTNKYAIGKYDENRAHLYSSELFQDEENDIDGFDGARTIHIGVDLGGPVGSKVFSFWHGVIHSSGYNPDLGDYGHVVVVEYDLEDIRKKTHSDVGDNDNDTGSSSYQNKVWCLYGHLDKKTVMEHKRWKTGDKVKRGELIGRMGDVRDNGGWQAPHVHFQLSIYPPASHDMPGAVSPLQRPEGLVQYPDPRLVLGEIY